MNNPASSDAFTLEVAELIVDCLNLEDVTASGIDPDAPLFGDHSGLGLDSIDALEIALAISQRYGFQLKSDDDDDNLKIFASLRALAEHVAQHRTT